MLLLAVLPAIVVGRELLGRPDDGRARRSRPRRQGRVAFALIDADGTLHQRGGRATFRTASLLKPLLLATYLRRSDVRGRSLTKAERALLDPMIRRSDNNAANTIIGRSAPPPSPARREPRASGSSG